jgi:hypothetical protein
MAVHLKLFRERSAKACSARSTGRTSRISSRIDTGPLDAVLDIKLDFSDICREIPPGYRSSVAFRSGPTLTILIGAPASFSRVFT